MTIEEENVQQLQQWLANADGNWRVEALIDLPGMEWITVEALQLEGDCVRLTYRASEVAEAYDRISSTLKCSANCLQAIRRVPRAKMIDAQVANRLMTDFPLDF